MSTHHSTFRRSSQIGHSPSSSPLSSTRSARRFMPQNIKHERARHGRERNVDRFPARGHGPRRQGGGEQGSVFSPPARRGARGGLGTPPVPGFPVRMLPLHYVRSRARGL